MRLCECHGVPLQKNGVKWRCAVKENERARLRMRARRAANPEQHRVALRRRVFSGRTYMGHAKSVEEANTINQYVKSRLAELKDRQASERKETAWLAEQ